eukprot:14225681-Alexandrium_andersonii.AAC.1
MIVAPSTSLRGSSKYHGKPAPPSTANMVVPRRGWRRQHIMVLGEYIRCATNKHSDTIPSRLSPRTSRQEQGPSLGKALKHRWTKSHPLAKYSELRHTRRQAVSYSVVRRGSASESCGTC